MDQLFYSHAKSGQNPTAPAIPDMTAPGTYRGISAQFDKMPPGIRWYYEHLPSLAIKYSWEVTLAYMFARLEAGQRRTLYAGLIKMHRASSAIAWRAIDEHHLSATRFKQLFEAVFGEPADIDAIKALRTAQPARNAVMHGQSVADASIRSAVIGLLHYSHYINEQTGSLAGFCPYGDLHGFRGCGKPISDSDTQALLTRLRLTRPPR
jgi:hypothetical protein